MIEIGLGHYLTLSAIIFTIGIFGIFLNRKNVIVILMSIELILLAVNINLVSFSVYTQDLLGQIFAMFILAVAAAEAALHRRPQPDLRPPGNGADSGDDPGDAGRDLRPAPSRAPPAWPSRRRCSRPRCNWCAHPSRRRRR